MRADLRGRDRAGYVRGMFHDIAPRYDLMNRLMTAGQDVRWRREVIARAGLRPGQRLLDLGAGTGDLARDALRLASPAQVVAADFTVGMMLAGRARHPRPEQWSGADALHLPFPEHRFDALVSGFLLRNVVDLDAALREQLRVLVPGGRMVALDTTRPRAGLHSPFVRFHMRTVIPWLGGLLTGAREAYTYLPETSENFLAAEDLAARMTAAGFEQVGFVRRMAGTIAIHWGTAPA